MQLQKNMGQNDLTLVEEQQDLQAMTEKFIRLYDSSPDMYVSVDAVDAKIKDCNLTLALKTGYKKEEIIGQTIFFLYHPDCFLKVKSAFRSFVTSGRVSNAELILKRKDGSKIVVLLNVEAIRDEEGKILYSNSCIRDISDIKILEKQLLKTNQELERKNRELSEFVYIASHDLQEPLRTVRNYSDFLSKRYLPSFDKPGQDSLTFINEAAERMNKLVNGLLDYSRIGTTSQKVLVDSEKLVQTIIKDLGTKISESKAVISIDPLPSVWGYELEFRLLFQNLICNAIKFSKKNQVPKIKIAAEQIQGSWKFSISDNGIGISETDQEKIFLIFKRLHNKEQYEGTGIGLAHCQKIINLHKGFIWVDSIPNQGSTFCFTIPNNKKTDETDGFTTQHNLPSR